MNNQMMRKVAAMSKTLSGQSTENDRLGRLSDESADTLRKSGIMKMLMPKECGGEEAHPNDFFEAVMGIAAQDPSAGWIAGVVGVHPVEAALNDARLLEEIWGEDPEMWIASPYAPMGVLSPTDGGYILNGCWTFSSGTDHCGWVVLGALMGDKEGAPLTPPSVFHVMLPRSDYEVLEDTWDVVGLRGTGSKDVVIKNSFVPDYRVLSIYEIMDGSACVKSGRKNPIYRMPWMSVFANAISAAILGACEGAVNSALEYQKARVAPNGDLVKDDPYVLSAMGEAMAEIRSSKVTMFYNTAEIFDLVSAGKVVSVGMRAAGQRDQVRGAWRAVRAMNEVYTRCGGTALRVDYPMHRFWRDANAGLNHAAFVPGPVYHAAAAVAMELYPKEVLAKANIVL